MRLALLALGTRGDVQPFVALGEGLKRAGHEVSVCAPESFAPLVTAHGLRYAPMTDEVVQLTRAQEGREVLADAGTPLGLAKGWVRLARRVLPMQRRVLDDVWAAAQGADALLYHPKVFGGPDLSERLGVPAFLVLPAPALVPTGAFPCPVLPSAPIPRPFRNRYNHLTYLLPRLMARSAAGVVDRWRAETLLLPPRRQHDPLRGADGRKIPVLHAFSPHVLPPPPDWSAYDTAVTGYWFLDEPAYTPPAELSDFLEAGSPPVYVGFGSLGGRDPARTAQVVLGALQRSGQRGLLATGWGGLRAAELPESVFGLEGAPHDWLFSRVRAVVHHGGAGTTAAGLRAGKPTVICPFFGDQPFWGARVAALGVGPEPIPQRELTTENLAAAFKRVATDEAMARRAAVLGAKLRAEDGVGSAVRFIERHVAAGRQRVEGASGR